MPKTHFAPSIAIVVSRYNESITGALKRGAVAEFKLRTGLEKVEAIIPVPGAYELPVMCLTAAQSGRFSGVLALGCLIKGETSHDRYIAEAVAHGLMGVTLKTGIPVAFGVLTTDTAAQAKARAGGDKGNKGAESMAALLETIEAMRALERENGREFQRTIEALNHDTKPDKAKGRTKLAGGRA